MWKSFGVSTTTRHSINTKLYTPKFHHKKPLKPKPAPPAGKTSSMLKKYLVGNQNNNVSVNNDTKFSDKGGTPMNYSVSNTDNLSFEGREATDASQFSNRSHLDAIKVVQTPRATVAQKIQGRTSKRSDYKIIKPLTLYAISFNFLDRLIINQRPQNSLSLRSQSQISKHQLRKVQEDFAQKS